MGDRKCEKVCKTGSAYITYAKIGSGKKAKENKNPVS